MSRPRDTTGDGHDILTPKGRSWLVLLAGLIAVGAIIYAVVAGRDEGADPPIGATSGEVVNPPDSNPVGPTSTSTSTTIDIDGCMSLLNDLTVATIPTDDLPPEAFDTLAFIVAGPPYPYRADGSVFQNRERLLPIKERGYYREFTVVTPGSNDRGARRIVAGDCGERWYTDDHYSSFRLIEGP